MNAWRPDIDEVPTVKWPRTEVDAAPTVKWPRMAIDQAPTLPMPIAPYAPADAAGQWRRAPTLAAAAPPHSASGAGLANLTRAVDRLSGGRAALIGRLATYLAFGGTAALINLVVFALVLRVPLPIPDFARNLVAFAVAAEVATLANFIPNDQITFRHLPGYSRVWWQRCLRFHATCAAGTALTYAIQAGLHYGVGVGALVSEAIALVIVTAFNFTTHHLFTYARTRGDAHLP